MSNIMIQPKTITSNRKPDWLKIQVRTGPKLQRAQGDGEARQS